MYKRQAVDSVLIPIQCEFYALEGVSQLVSTIELVKKSLNPSLKVQEMCIRDSIWKIMKKNGSHTEAKYLFPETKEQAL